MSRFLRSTALLVMRVTFWGIVAVMIASVIQAVACGYALVRLASQF